MKILILGVAAVQYDAILALKNMGHEVHAVARHRDGKGADVADYFAEIDFSDTDAVKNYIREHDIDAIYSVGSDLAMPISAKISEDLDLPRFISPETAITCNNKGLLREALGKDFRGNVPNQILSEVDEELELKFPFILKPSDSQGQRGVYLVHNQEEYEEKFPISKGYSRSGTVIVEKYVDGPEISVNGYVVDGQLKFCLSSDRETWEQYVGLIRKHIVPAYSVSKKAQENVEVLMQNAVEKLGIKNGPVYAQIKVEGDEPYIIEITPRLDGCHMWKLIEYSTGVNLLEITFNHLLGVEQDFDAELEYKEAKDFDLRFICEVPNTVADYSDEEENIENALESFKYYEEGQTIRPVNGKYDKIAYLMNEGV